jgi:hypothetical protein
LSLQTLFKNSNENFANKYFMRINEVTSPLNKFIATVRVKGTQARTLIDAESASHARLMLEKQYGEKNVVSVSHIKLLDEQNHSHQEQSTFHESRRSQSSRTLQAKTETSKS